MLAKLSSLSGIIVAVVVGVTLVTCTSLLVRGVIQVKGTQSMIRVTGSARKAIKSDFIIWTGKVTARATSLAEAYKSLKAGMESARAYLIANGVPKDEVKDLAITTRTLYAPLPKGQVAPSYEDAGAVFRQIEGYELS